MLTSLRLKHFKNFEDAELPLGPFTVLVGTNASGKSNLRDAFRVLHGISRGYTVAEILGEKWGEGGERQWKGIRGGVREAAYWGEGSFEIGATVQAKGGRLAYSVEIALPENGLRPIVTRERLALDEGNTLGFVALTDGPIEAMRLKAGLGEDIEYSPEARTHYLERSDEPFLTTCQDQKLGPVDTQRMVRDVLGALSSMRFLDLQADAMRIPSLPGQNILGDRGENLSSVLHAICQDPARKHTLTEWIRQLTPVDAVDFEFAPDAAGKILVTLVEENGQKTSALSASDGTLRFLAILAALLGPEPARFYFIEELENGIHPTRLHLLTQLIELHATRSQVVATTHSPQLLAMLGPKAQGDAVLLYRLPGHAGARIRRIVDIPQAREVLQKRDMARLHSSGWLETAVAFTDDLPSTP